jgi:hypothetical protein
MLPNKNRLSFHVATDEYDLGKRQCEENGENIKCENIFQFSSEMVLKRIRKKIFKNFPCSGVENWS